MRDNFFDGNQEFLIEILTKSDDISVNLVIFEKISWRKYRDMSFGLRFS
jgi:hypothetical protein